MPQFQTRIYTLCIRMISSIKGISKLITTRFISNSPVTLAIPKKNKLPPRPKWLIIEQEIDEKFVKGGRGPGGQKINKTNSKVQLTHKPTGIVVTCQYTRSQELNRKKAREILAARLEDLQNPTGSRNAVIEERKSKVKQNKEKKSNRKYILLDKERAEEVEKLKEVVVVDPEAEFDTFLDTLKSKV